MVIRCSCGATAIYAAIDDDGGKVKEGMCSDHLNNNYPSIDIDRVNIAQWAWWKDRSLEEIIAESLLDLVEATIASGKEQALHDHRINVGILANALGNVEGYSYGDRANLVKEQILDEILA